MQEGRSSPVAKPASSRRQANIEATRAAVLDAARLRFGQVGYTAASLADIATAAGVTTGAIYHHFGDKRGLFLEIAKLIEGEILQRAAEAGASADNPWDLIEAGIATTLDMCGEAEIRQIILLDAPNVIGPAEWRKIELQFGYGMMLAALTALEQLGQLRAPSAEILAPILLGALIEAANTVAVAVDQPAATAQATETLRLLLQGLKKNPTG